MVKVDVWSLLWHIVAGMILGLSVAFGAWLAATRAGRRSTSGYGRRNTANDRAA